MGDEVLDRMTEDHHRGNASDPRERARSALRVSRVVGVATGVRTRLGSLGRAAGDVVRESYVYRWLTKEPEPEVVVIDLRETWTVGPVIGALDRVVDRVAPHWRRSTVKSSLDRVAALVGRGLRTRLGRLLVALLEPPEPPASADRESEPGSVVGSAPDDRVVGKSKPSDGVVDESKTGDGDVDELESEEIDTGERTDTDERRSNS